MGSRFGNPARIDAVARKLAMSLIHGGDLYSASKRFGRPINDWLDLSTGINVHSYPIPTIAPPAWQRLPYLEPQLLQAAQHYYGSDHVLLTAGSQAVIERLPEILHQQGNRLCALLPDIGYQEHHRAWGLQTTVMTYSGLIDASAQISDLLNQPNVGHLVLINPNNPTGSTYGPDQIRTWAQQLAKKQGYVVVDEAFIDCQPQHSVMTQDMPDNVLVLRSFGKFFGLAGIRLGAMIAPPRLRQQMTNIMGPWCVNGPAQAIATEAFQNLAWQQSMVQQLQLEQGQQRALWQDFLLRIGTRLQADTPLFRSFLLPATQAEDLHTLGAKAGILVRPVPITETTTLVRVGNIDLTNQPHLDRCRAWQISIG
jgi:cobalamin biosynthetic protein CobC